ncbi:Histone-lysine N-methyltransferase SETMAR [Habropoda laboriosa]|uniref:Histone-lysine N-methyltransferase SETMAR n=1 Tax=Habropoda laboriosa TaxID=597456 RepID=A0A0L7QNK9_9HYME|nr:Histone-lysine N-methyltransferase SETMAR [Habropoda laboriosa]
MSNFLANRKLKNDVEVETAIDSFLESETREFYKKGMYKLTERWKRVVELNGNYFIEYTCFTFVDSVYRVYHLTLSPEIFLW